MPFEIGRERRGSLGGGLALMVLLSVLLCWLPVIGPLLAGVFGGRKARRPSSAFAAGLVVGGLWAIGLMLASSHSVKVGQQDVQLGPLGDPFSTLTGLSVLSGALLGSVGRGARSAGALVLLAGLLWTVPRARDQWPAWRLLLSVARESSAQKPPAPVATDCPDRLTKLYNAMMIYTGSWDDTYPPADRWMTAIKDNVPDDKLLHCPSAPGGPQSFGYAMNAALGSKRLKDVKDPTKTPLLYDSTNLKQDAHDTVTSLPNPGRHEGHNYVLYADGSVK